MMKKTLTVLCAAVLFVCAAFPACAAGASLVGDVNLDGKITNTDMLLLKQHIVETTVLTGQSFNNADINGDDRITTTDVQMLNQMLLSDVDFPVSGMISFPYDGGWYTLSEETVRYSIQSPQYTVGSGAAQGKVLMMPAHRNGMYLTILAERGDLDLVFFGYNGSVLWDQRGFWSRYEVSSGEMKQFYVGGDVWFILVAGNTRQNTSTFRYKDAYPL